MSSFMLFSICAIYCTLSLCIFQFAQLIVHYLDGYPELIADIEKAFSEIGEDPENIKSIKYDSVKETALFDRRDYKVTFKRKQFYRITTEEWHEGEPEREQYPREYLVTIKFWMDDKQSTSVNEWTHTGNGKQQNGSDYAR